MSILIVVFMVFAVLLGLAALVGLAIWAGSRASKTRMGAVSLAQQLGFRPVQAGLSPADTWYEGVGQGRRVATKVVALINPAATSGPRRTAYLRIAMEVVVRQPLGAMALRSIRNASGLQRFEEAFSTENPQRIGPEARKAMLEFVALGYPVGLQGTTYRNSPGTRNLWLKDRAAIEDGPLATAVMPDARTVIVYDHPHPGIDVNAFGKLLYEMALVAHALERGA